ERVPATSSFIWNSELSWNDAAALTVSATHPQTNTAVAGDVRPNLFELARNSFQDITSFQGAIAAFNAFIRRAGRPAVFVRQPTTVAEALAALDLQMSLDRQHDGQVKRSLVRVIPNGSAIGMLFQVPDQAVVVDQASLQNVHYGTTQAL